MVNGVRLERVLGCVAFTAGTTTPRHDHDPMLHRHPHGNPTHTTRRRRTRVATPRNEDLKVRVVREVGHQIWLQVGKTLVPLERSMLVSRVPLVPVATASILRHYGASALGVYETGLRLKLIYRKAQSFLGSVYGAMSLFGSQSGGSIWGTSPQHPSPFPVFPPFASLAIRTSPPSSTPTPRPATTPQDTS